MVQFIGTAKENTQNDTLSKQGINMHKHRNTRYQNVSTKYSHEKRKGERERQTDGEALIQSTTEMS